MEGEGMGWEFEGSVTDEKAVVGWWQQIGVGNQTGTQPESRRNPKSIFNTTTPTKTFSFSIHCGLRELRHRIDTVKSTQKITETMKLVAAAKIRSTQEAVINGRTFAETLIEFLYSINQQLQLEDVDVPLTIVRPVKRVALVESLWSTDIEVSAADSTPAF
ncbi:ATPase, F1 complex, gamma subunit protein [Actinidia rufa]|uniref:ATPase, F1 complex, gamma subunit protein n=1 Tax=Actinidia rufa TaxID=165716 RepID=A0A7J0G9M9_9ERIC|nr:ATPase, F1 complex, gamma subunit protein [Actinidia rufa]